MDRRVGPTGGGGVDEVGVGVVVTVVEGEMAHVVVNLVIQLGAA